MNTKPIEQTLQEREREREAESKKQESETVAAKITRFLEGGMGAAEMDDFSKTDAAEIDAAIRKREQDKARRRARDERHAAEQWADVYDEEELAVAMAEVRKFVLKHPTFRGDIVENRNVLLYWLIDEKLLCTADNLERAYQDLKPRGVFIEKTEEERRIEKMSAKDFKKEHASDWPAQGIPPLVLQSVGKVLDTFSAAHPEYVHSEGNKNKILAALEKCGVPVSVQAIEEIYQDLAARRELELKNAVMEYGASRIIDLGGRPQGFPKESEKYSFKMKIRSMTADQIAERCANDPAFKEASITFETVRNVNKRLQPSVFRTAVKSPWRLIPAKPYSKLLSRLGPCANTPRAARTISTECQLEEIFRLKV
jgi:hypothetical protein